VSLEVIWEEGLIYHLQEQTLLILNGNPLVNKILNNSIIDTFGCLPTVLPNSISCNNNNTTPYDRAKYRQFVLNDSGTITISNFPASATVNTQNYTFGYELFEGNANNLANAQNAWNYPQKINGLTTKS
jgi:hypothetical protein